MADISGTEDRAANCGLIGAAVGFSLALFGIMMAIVQGGMVRPVMRTWGNAAR